jgi:hypothetical protein
MPGVTDVDIEPAVVVDIYENDAGAPHAILFEACFVGDVFKFKIAFIEIELVAAHVGCEEDVWEAVIVDVSDGYAAAVVKVPEQEAVIQLAVFNIISKVDAGIFLEFE